MDDCALDTRAIIKEAERRAAESDGDAIQIAVQLAIAGWQPVPTITAECRNIVGAYYRAGPKRDEQMARGFEEGKRDHFAEMTQAITAMKRGITMAAEWLDMQCTEYRTGVRMLGELLEGVD